MKKQLFRQIIAFEIAAFLIVIVLFWLNELLDLPHRIMGAPVTPVNYAESMLSTGVVLLLGAGVIYITYTLIQRIKFLEGILPVCSFCKRIRVEEDWVAIDSYISDNSEADFSHSVCPHCAAEQYGIRIQK